MCMDRMTLKCREVVRNKVRSGRSLRRRSGGSRSMIIQLFLAALSEEVAYQDLRNGRRRRRIESLRHRVREVKI